MAGLGLNKCRVCPRILDTEEQRHLWYIQLSDGRVVMPLCKKCYEKYGKAGKIPEEILPAFLRQKPTAQKAA